MKKLFSYFIPIGAGVAIMFFALPAYGGNLDILAQKMALDWEIPVFAMRAILAVVMALILTFLFDILAKVGIWLAIIAILLAVFAPAVLSNIPVVSEEVKKEVQEKVETVVEEKLNS